MINEIVGSEIVQSSDPLPVGNRLLILVSRVLSLETTKGKTLFGALVSPLALIVLETDHYYAFPLGEQKKGQMDIDNLLDKLPSLREQIAMRLRL